MYYDKIPAFILFLDHHFIFQVVTGGHYDVDVVLTDPLKNVLYKEERQHIVIGKGKLINFCL
jgi:hypothetical protein